MATTWRLTWHGDTVALGPSTVADDGVRGGAREGVQYGEEAKVVMRVRSPKVTGDDRWRAPSSGNSSVVVARMPQRRFGEGKEGTM